jgi:putative DNA primase/helicase
MGIATKHLSESERAAIARTLFTVTSEEKGKGEIHGLCPIHGESNPSFSYNYQKDSYNCFSCGASGDLIRLWIEKNGLSQTEGFKAFCDEYGIELKHDHNHAAPSGHSETGRNAEKTEPAVELTHEQVIEAMQRAWDLFPPLPPTMVADLERKRGWSPAMIEMLNLRLETWRLSRKKGDLYQVHEPVKIAIPIVSYPGNGKLRNIRLYQPGAKEFKIISFGKTTGTSALFPPTPMYLDKPVLLCEGESDTICALSHGFNAITQTSKLIKWPDDHLAPFKGRDVVIAYDADQPGQKYARAAAQALTGVAKSVRMLLWPAFMGIDESGTIPDKHGQDLTDFFVRHKKSAGDLQALIDTAAPWPPPPIEIPPETIIPAPAEKQSGAPTPPPAAGTIEDTNDVHRFFESGVNNRYSFRPRLLAEQIIKDIPIMYEPQTGLVYQWNGRFWEILHEDYLKTRCLVYLRNESNKGRAEDATFQAKMLSMIPAGRQINDRTGYFCVENGMYCIEEDRLDAHAKEFYATYMFPVIYDPKNVPICERWLQFLKETIQTAEVIAQVQEFFGYCLTPSVAFEKCLLCLGPGADGKSTLLKILREMVGPMNCAAVNIEDLDDQFQRSSLYGKLLNISTEVGSKAMESKIFKAIVSGDAVQAAYKHENSFEFVPTCKMAFAANRFPRVLDNSDGFFRKILPVAFKRQFLTGADKGLFAALKKELSGIFHWSLIGRERLWAQQDFTESDETNRLLLDYRRSNNPVLCFLEDECELDPGDMGFEVSKSDLYNRYEAYCHDKGYSKYSEENFFRELRSARSNLEQYRPTVGGKREYRLKGIRLAVTLPDGGTTT